MSIEFIITSLIFLVVVFWWQRRRRRAEIRQLWLLAVTLDYYRAEFGDESYEFTNRWRKQFGDPSRYMREG